MNQVAVHPAFVRRLNAGYMTERCDLPMLAGIAVAAMAPLLERRQQGVAIESAGRPVIVRGDLGLVFSLVSAVVAEAAGLSSARARLRLAFDFDDGDIVLTIVGANSNNLPADLMQIDGQLAGLAREGGAELDMIWDAQEGPTFVLRFPNAQAGVVH